jgi:hypothetical protein
LSHMDVKKDVMEIVMKKMTVMEDVLAVKR